METAGDAKKQQKSERRELIVKWVTLLAKALGPPISDDRVRFYAEALDDLTVVQLEHGFALAKRHMGEFMPSVAQLREWCESYRPASVEPPVRAKEQPVMADVRPSSRVTPEEIAQWLEEGKQAQREYIRQLQADPKWREMKQRLTPLRRKP